MRNSVWDATRARLDKLAVINSLAVIVSVVVIAGCASTPMLESTAPGPAGSVQASIPRLEVPDLTRMSRAVVVGTVREKLPPVTANEQEGGRRVRRVYTDYRFAVTDSLRGPYFNGEEIVLPIIVAAGNTRGSRSHFASGASCI